MKFHLKEREVVVGAAAAVTVIGVKRIGVPIPALGPLSSPMVAILLGFVLAGMVDGGGTGGDVIEGVGYGLIAYGALAF